MNGNFVPSILLKEYQLGNEALNEELEKFVVEQMARKDQKKEQHSNIGGWQSERDLHAKLGVGTPYSNALLKLFSSFSAPMMDYINSCCSKWNVKPSKSYDWDYTDAWFNVSARGGYNAPHTHPLSAISGAYYIRTEEPPAGYPFSGRIDFYNENGEQYYFPKAGTLILFPGTMLHFVHPYYGTGHRICLSFNANNIRGLKS